MIQAIAFDVDQTLWDFHTHREAALRACLILVLDRATEQIASRWTIEDLQARYDRIEISAPGERLASIRRESLSDAAEEAAPGDPDLGDDLTELYFSIRHGPAEPYADAIPALTDLKAMGLRLAIVTNGNSDLDTLGLTDLFEAVVIGPNIGMAKPEPRIYAEVERLVGVDASSLVCVGDDPHRDVAAPQRRGWKGVWNDRGIEELPNSVLPDATVQLLTELPSVVESWKHTQ
ncbi:MAG: HAD family hydrolase [Actinomycetia bacterium]|nr:HAD family hydrolase [Actinomycetes bacterium]MCP4962502.1 HAD family hydrolase [Actinomycetes bacterium]